MSIINDFFEKLTGLDLDGSDGKKVTERPCANCPSDCAIAGEACTICEPYKKKLIDWVYHVDHLDEFRSQYEVISPAQQAAMSGTTHCPFCGASSADHYICEYCGSKLADKPASSGKIQVTSASEIPNPIMEAQDVIYDRYETVIKKYSKQETEKSSGSFLSNLFSQLLGAEANDEESALGAKMSEAEITEAASLYNITVGDYLTGLDNGKYLTLSGKKEADANGKPNYSPSSAGLAGIAGIGMLASGMISNSGNSKRWEEFSRRPAQRPSSASPRPYAPYDRQNDYLQRPQQNEEAQKRRPRPEEQNRTPVRPSASRRDEQPSRPVSTNNESKRIDRPQPAPAQRQSPQRPSQSSSSNNSTSNRWKERTPGKRGDDNSGRRR